MVRSSWRRAIVAGAGLMLTLASVGVGLTSTAQAATHKPPKHIKIAYLSYAVANSYDAPMLAAAEAVASADGASVTVFDAQNSYTTQVSQLEDVINSGQYQGIITQPIYGAALVPAVKKAIAKGIKVVNIDQILGSNYASDGVEVHGLSANVVFFPSKIGSQLAALTLQACGSASPCKVGLVHNFEGYEPDSEITKTFTAGLGSSATIVDQVDGQYNQATALTQVQDMLVANPDVNVIVGSDQDCEGAQAALAAAKNTTTKLVCYGASAAGLAGVKSGAWFADVAQAPASEGQLGMIALIKAIKTGKNSGVINPVAALPDNGVLTKATVSKFTAQWPG